MSTRMLVRDKPAAWWFLAVLFVIVSLGFLYLGIKERDTLPAWQPPLFILFALGGVAAGVWLGRESPLSTIFLDEADGALIVSRFGIGGHSEFRVPADSIRKVIIEERKDDEGYDMTRPALLLKDGESVRLSLLWRHGDVDTLHIARHVVKAIPRLAGGDPRLTT
jgi:hypothetical protein